MDYSQKALEYISSIRNYLKAKYGEVSPEWELMLNLLLDNVEQYYRCMETIDEAGIYNFETNTKNPLLSTAKDLQASIFKIVQHFGISPYAASKIKQADEDTSDLFVDDLVNG